MRWLAFGTYDVQAHPRVAVLLEGLGDCGEDVTEVVEPLGLPTSARVALVRQPWRLLPVLARVGIRWARVSRRGWPALRATPGPDVVLVGYLGLVDVLLARGLTAATRLTGPRRRRPRPLLVLDHLVSASGTAADRGLAQRGGAKDRALRGLDRLAIAAVDVVVVDTPQRLTELPDGVRSRAVVVAVGATDAWFAAGAARTDGPSPAATDSQQPLRVVFAGLFTPLQGTVTIALALVRLEPLLRQGVLSCTLAGSGQDLAQVQDLAGRLPGVTWLDWVPAPELPAFVAAHDVGLGIFGTTPKALSVVPTKVFQAAAAGCAVVTSDTAPQRFSLGDAALFVPAGDPDRLAEALVDLTTDRTALARLGRAARARAEVAYRPAIVVRPLLDRLEEAGR